VAADHESQDEARTSQQRFGRNRPIEKSVQLLGIPLSINVATFGAAIRGLMQSGWNQGRFWTNNDFNERTLA
jgi:hypothetical protein